MTFYVCVSLSYMKYPFYRLFSVSVQLKRSKRALNFDINGHQNPKKIGKKKTEKHVLKLKKAEQKNMFFTSLSLHMVLCGRKKRVFIRWPNCVWMVCRISEIGCGVRFSSWRGRSLVYLMMEFVSCITVSPR